MKSSKFILFVVLISANVRAQDISGHEIDMDLHKCYSKLLNYRFGSESYEYDSIEMQNKIFRTKIEEYTARYPFTISYKFDSLLNDKINIVTSGDGLFRIYSWSTWLGGTMENFENICQYKTDGKVYSKSIHSSFVDQNEPYVYFYSNIFSVKENNKTYYLAVSNGIYSTSLASQGIKVFCLENGGLNDTVQIIKTELGIRDEESIGFDFFSVVKRPERPLRLIKYDSVKKIIYMPILLENGTVTKKYDRYQFTGRYFERIKNDRDLDLIQ